MHQYEDCSRQGTFEKVFYLVLHLPWPVSERDVAFRRLKSVDSSTGSVTYELTAALKHFHRKKEKSGSRI